MARAKQHGCTPWLLAMLVSFFAGVASFGGYDTLHGDFLLDDARSAAPVNECLDPRVPLRDSCVWRRDFWGYQDMVDPRSHKSFRPLTSLTYRLNHWVNLALSNRTAAEVRHAFSKGGGNMGSTGCVGYLFQKKGVIFVMGGDEDEVMMLALDAGAEDVTSEEGGFEVLTAPEDFASCSDGLADGGLEISSASVMQIPDTRTTVTGEDAGKLLKLLELLDDCDDVQAIHHNGDIDAEELERLQG